MKPTLSYVRALRNVLDIPTREDRREYIKNQERKDAVYGFLESPVTLPLALLVGVVASFTTNDTTMHELIFLSSLIGGTAVFSLANLRNYSSRRKKRLMQFASAAHQRRDAFYDDRLALDNF